MVGTEVDKKPYILSRRFGGLFVGINYNAFDEKEEPLEEFLKSRDKFCHCKDIVYDIILPKIAQLYCTSDQRKYKWVNMRMGTGRLKHQMESSLRIFLTFTGFWEDIYYGRKISKTIFPLNYSL